MTECPICLTEFAIGVTVNKVETECGHVFHCSCLMKNVAHNGFNCPYCRNNIAENPIEEESDDDEDVEDDILSGFRWFFRQIEETPIQVMRDGVITNELNLDEDGYYFEGEYDYWEEDNQYIHPPYLFHKLANNGQYDEESIRYTDLALAYIALKRRYDGIIMLQAGDIGYNTLPNKCIPLYDDCKIYRDAETKVNRRMEAAINGYYIKESDD